MSFDHRQIEKKWQKYWEENETFKAQEDRSKEKFYVLDMFPYPSGAGLHVGHVLGYTATDILARYKRMKGYSVLHPMGWDSFGLPAEQYAVRTGTHPRETTEKNINTYRRQLKMMGFSYDWSREMATSDPNYYKWTQWIFTLLYEKGLAYEAESHVNYCPALKMVLANEEVEEGRSKEGGHLVERRPMRQWILKITAYAERLLEDLEALDWPEHLKRQQVNWIGKSVGATINFKAGNEEISVFTTRQDTLFGVEYLVLAPEHPLVEKLVSDEQRAAVEEYQKQSLLKSDLDRTELAKEKSGVFIGAYAQHPALDKKLPIWIGDYVLVSYGTGAVMAVPGHDERDFEFAQKYKLPISCVVEPKGEHEDYQSIIAGKACYPEQGRAVNSSGKDLNINGLKTEEAKKSVSQWLEANGCGQASVSYKLRDWLFSRQRYWGEPVPILHFEDGSKRALGVDELPLMPPSVEDYKPADDGSSPLARVDDWVNIVDDKTGKRATRETNTMPQWAGSCWYYLRFVDPNNNQEAWAKDKENYWLPVDVYVGGAEHAVLHLLYARFWHKVLYDLGLVSTKEPFQCLRNQGMITARSFKNSLGAYVDVHEVEEKQGEYLHKASGEKLRSQLEKMSKSKLNGVTPDELVEEFGADALRLYEMFMGPFDKEKVWNTSAVSGAYRFLNRIYKLFDSEKYAQPCEEALRLTHKLIAGVTEDIDNWQYNTAIAKMMEFMNDFSPLPGYPKEALNKFLRLLAPFAPHTAEELWERLGETGSVSLSTFPQAESKYLAEPKGQPVTYVVQVNGRLRGRLELEKDLTEEGVFEAAIQEEGVKKHMGDSQVVKRIFVPNKLLNIVVKA